MAVIYPDLALGAKRRLAMFKAEASNGRWVRPMTWRDMRFATLTTPTGWYSYVDSDGDRYAYLTDGKKARGYFRSVASAVHGYYTDTDNCEICWPRVARLSHGRFLAGYFWDSNDVLLFQLSVIDDEQEAWRLAYELAECFAERVLADR